MIATAGYLEAAVAGELPGLRLGWVAVAARDGPSPPGLALRLAELSGRYRGASVVAMRTKPIPHAYRACFRQLGLDPDSSRIPSEAAAVQRLLRGGFAPTGLVADALLLAVLETGVPVWALDAERIEPAAEGGIGIRTARAGERLGAGAHADHLPPGTLVVADANAVLAVLFGDLAADRAVTRRTRALLLFAVAVAGVPAIHVEEALWTATEALGATPAGW
jgi:DNA/RNA-binding domain of Phe-tRNA-synthetase-like protein